MAGVYADISLIITGRQEGTNDLGTPKLPFDIRNLVQFEPGTNTVGKADLMFADTRTLAASANEDLDFAGGLTDAFGATITMAEVVLVYIKAAAGNTNNVQVTRPASTGLPIFMAAGDGRALLPGEFELIVSQAGIAVTASTGDKINIANSAGSTSVTYDILVVGRSVAA